MESNIRKYINRRNGKGALWPTFSFSPSPFSFLATSSFRPLLPWSHHHWRVSLWLFLPWSASLLTPTLGNLPAAQQLHLSSRYRWDCITSSNLFLSSQSWISVCLSFPLGCYTYTTTKTFQTTLLFFHSSKFTSLMILYCSLCKVQSPAQDWKVSPHLYHPSPPAMSPSTTLLSRTVLYLDCPGLTLIVTCLSLHCHSCLCANFPLDCGPLGADNSSYSLFNSQCLTHTRKSLHIVSSLNQMSSQCYCCTAGQLKSSSRIPPGHCR